MKQGASQTMNNIGSFIGRLTSRKFLLTIFGIVAVTTFPEQSAAIVTLIAAFVGAEGAADAVSRYSESQTESVVARDKILLSTDLGEDDIDSNSPPITGREASLPSPVSTGGSAPL